LVTHRTDRSGDILRTATRLFHERGFDGVSVDEIGEQAGVSGPAIYRYFRGKEDILATLIDEALDRILMSIGGTFDDPQEELDHLVRGHTRRAIEEPELVSIWTKDRNALPKSIGVFLRTRIARYVDRWIDCLDACYPGHSREELAAAAYAVQGLIDSSTFWPVDALTMTDLDDLLTGLAMKSLSWLSISDRATAAELRRPKAGPNT
jgi:AcrR family transcriptional regulator